MFIETSIVDNNTTNFHLPLKIAPNGTTEIKDSKSVRRSALSENLFDLGGIKSVLITPETISVTKDDDTSWEELKPQILAEIMDFISTGQTIFNDQEKPSSDETIKKIIALIETRIRPIIQRDGGDILFKSFSEGTVYVELIGNCKTCPYAMITLKEGVEKILKTYIDEVKYVENIAGE